MVLVNSVAQIQCNTFVRIHRPEHAVDSTSSVLVGNTLPQFTGAKPAKLPTNLSCSAVSVPSWEHCQLIAGSGCRGLRKRGLKCRRVFARGIFRVHWL